MTVVRQMPAVSIVALLLIGALVSGCAQRRSTAPERVLDQAGMVQTDDEAKPDDTQGLRLALLPVLDVLPMHVAEQNGYFHDLGLQVEFVPVKSPQERDTLMQTGQVDGMLTDLISPVLFNQDTVQIKALRTARRAYRDAPMFRILAAPGSEIRVPAQLAGVGIGVSQNSVIEYLTDRMLEEAGLSPDQIAIQEVSAIPVRFELLVNGEIPAANLPDPLASGAIQAGAVPVIDDSTVPELSQSILAFSVKALESKPEEIRLLLQAWETAVTELNAHPDSYGGLLIEKGRIPESVQGSFTMPHFPEASVPTKDQLEDVMEWMIAKGIVQKRVPYEWMVDDAFLP